MALAIVVTISILFADAPNNTKQIQSTPSNHESQTVSKTKTEQKGLKKMSSIMVASTQFKEIASKDYASALLTLSKDEGMKKLHIIDKALWEAKISQIGWDLFFTSSIRIYNKNLAMYPLVGFYNPFSDVLLITVWKEAKEGYRIVDAEMLMGDLLRGTTKGVSNVPFWRRDKQHPLSTLGISVALSVVAFEEIFNMATNKNWRTKALVLNDSATLNKFNYPNISIALNSHLFNVSNFSNIKIDNPQLQECPNQTQKILHNIKKGNINDILITAEDTPPDTADILKKISSEWIDGLAIVSALNNGRECLVLLTSMQQSTGSISFSFKRKTEDQSLLIKRIDIIDYQQLYNKIKSYLEQKRLLK